MPNKPPTHRPFTTRGDGRASAAKRGYGRRWQRLRKMILARDPICRWPGCTMPATDVDHVVPRAAGGDDSEGNLQGLCHEHHSLKTASEDGGFGRSVTGEG
jgi:5-methylcytosine-specific restriction protein A